MQCGVCGAGLPAVRAPRNTRELLWGGWTCKSCGVELDRHAQPVETRIDLPDRVLFQFGGRPSKTAATLGTLVVVTLLGTLVTASLIVAGLDVLAMLTVVLMIAVCTAGASWAVVLVLMGKPRLAQVGLHALQLDEVRIPYDRIRAIEQIPNGFRLQLGDGAEEVVKGPAALHACLVDALLKYRSNQESGEAVDSRQAESLAQLVRQ